MELLNPLSRAQAKATFFEKPTFEANCLVTDLIGHWVFVTAEPIAGRAQVTKVDIGDATTMPAVGVIVAKTASPLECTIQWMGTTSIYGSLDRSRPYFVSSASTITKVPPSTISPFTHLQKIGIALDSGTLLIIPNVNMLVRRT